MGGPGCGLPAAAFCETFGAPAAVHGRAGELDARTWSAGRLAPQLPTGNGVAIAIGPGAIPNNCRAGLPSTVLPSQDALICDANSNIMSNHLMVASAAQNYGQNSYRIRQPFDFGGRTGKIVFDAEARVQSPLVGWTSIDVTEDPIDAPSFAVGSEGTQNNEGSLVPKNGFGLQFQDNCNGTAGFALRMLNVFQNYATTTILPPNHVCIPAQEGKLNHFELTVSQQKIEVSATPFSPDGQQFGAPSVLISTAVNLPFARGYVQISVHNHASMKYTNDAITAWVARWDNVGFDGPIISNWREYEVPDALTPGVDGWNRKGPILSVGYRITDVTKGPGQTFKFGSVDLTDVETAKVSFASWFLRDPAIVATYGFKYRLNGKAWRDRPLDAGEVGQLNDSHSQGQLGQVVDVPLSDLVQGDNTFEIVGVNIPQSYPPCLNNINLVLTTRAASARKSK
jgi:hypothetical protein